MRINESTLIKQELTLNFLEVVFNKNRISLRKAVYSDELYDEYKRKQDFFIYRFNDSLYCHRKFGPPSKPRL